MTLAADLVGTDAALFALASAWQDLWARVEDAGPFTSPAWLLPWWRQFGTGTPRVGVLWQGDRLSGVLPLYRLPAERRVLPIGVGVSDHGDVLLAPDAPDGAATVLLEAALHGGTEPCVMPDVPAGSALVDAAPRGWRRRAAEGAACPALALSGLAAIPAAQRRKWRMARHRADRGEPWRVVHATEETLAGHLAALRALHAARWQERGEGGVLQDPAVMRLHEAAAPLLLRDHVLRLPVLRVGERVAGAVMAFRTARRLLFYIGGFDDAFAALSPGTLLIGALIEEALSEGVTEVDFLRGEEAYKLRWGAQARRLVSLTWEPA